MIKRYIESETWEQIIKEGTEILVEKPLPRYFADNKEIVNVP